MASGNDAIASHSPTRRTGKLMGQFLPGTDFVTCGYSVMPRRDNMFGGGNYDADDIDEWLTLQRDWQVDAGIEPATEERVLAVRERAAARSRRCSRTSGCRPSRRPRSRRPPSGATAATCRTATAPPTSTPPTACCGGAICALDGGAGARRRGFGDVAEAIVGMGRQRVSADYLQTSAIVDAAGEVHSAVNDPNLYRGPGTGYRLEGERWALLQALPHVVDPARFVELEDAGRGAAARAATLRSPARAPTRSCWRSAPRSATCCA